MKKIINKEDLRAKILLYKRKNNKEFNDWEKFEKADNSQKGQAILKEIAQTLDLEIVYVKNKLKLRV